MPHLRIKTVGRIKDHPNDLFAMQANGEIVFIDLVSIHDDNGKYIRTATMNRDLFNHLMNVKIPMP